MSQVAHLLVGPRCRSHFSRASPPRREDEAGGQLPGAVRLRGGILRASNPPALRPGQRRQRRRGGWEHKSGAHMLSMQRGQQQAHRPGEEDGAARDPEKDPRDVVCVDARCCTYW
jgi:hypothetical protein